MIGDTYFTSLANIGINLYTRHPKNLNHVHKDVNDILSVVFILGIDVHGDKTVFYRMTMNDIGKIAHVLNHSHVRCVFGAFDKISHEGSIWNGTRAVFSFILQKSIFLHFVHHVKKFIANIKMLRTEESLLMMVGVVYLQKLRIGIFMLKNIRRHIEIEVMLFPPHI